MLHAHAPLGQVEEVGPDVGHLAAGVFVPPAEGEVAALLGVGDQRCLAEPRVPIQMGWGLLGLERSTLGVLAQPDDHAPQLADAPGGDRFAGEALDVVAAEAGADLEGAAGLLDRALQELALVDRERQRLFAVDVLARPARGGGHGGVPVVGRADHDHVDVAAVQQLAIVLVQGGLGAEVLDGLLADLAVHVADGHHVAEGRGVVGDHGPLVAHPDGPDAEAVVF